MQIWKRILVGLFVLVGVTGCLLLELEEGGETAVSVTTNGGALLAGTPPPEGEMATVVQVIDGDTVDVLLGGQEYRLRYIGVDTPERDEPFYAEATAANAALVADKTVVLVRDVSETDRFGRLLRYVYLPDGTFVNGELIVQGYAQLVTFPPDVAEQPRLSAWQVEARQAKRGLWGIALPEGAVCACDRNAYNCADFDRQQEAQACFDYCRGAGVGDVHRLDGGGDGLVCESLP